jgi:tRNA (guanine-N7-)-methyltransferase
MTKEREQATARRTIRSFVRRAGRMTPSQQRALDELWPDYGVDYSDTPFDFNEMFGRTAPIVMEIGFGNGESLVELAAASPDQDYLGIEVHEPGVGHCLLKAQEVDLQNLKLVAHDAVEVLKNQVPSGSLSRVNLYFPDPWPKKRHHKRRIVQLDFVELIADKLGDGGTLNIATDWANYAEHIDEVLSQSDRFTCIERREHEGDRPFARPQTKFERRGLRKGHGISDRCFRKTANS